MNIEKDRIETQTVTALRNSWVVCKSKSHSGRIYYFNTLTGEAAWNLSDAEMEKASKRTKILESQPGSNLEFCPEPKDPPTDSVMRCKKNYSLEHNSYSSSLNMSNMQNKFPKHQLPNNPFLNTQCLNCTSHTVPDSNCVSVASNTSTFNPNIWTIPPNHQILIAQTTPLINQGQSSFEVAYSNLEHGPKHNKSMLHKRRGNLPYKQKNNSKNYRYNNMYNRFSQRKNFTNINYQHKKTQSFYNACDPSTSDDLRQKLAARRRSTFSNFSERDNQEKGNCTFPSTYQKRSIEPKIQIITPTAKVCSIDADDNWLKEYAYVDGTQLKLNVTSLKNIVMLDEKGSWYIVADSNTLLEHFKIINIIVNSDEQCQLMVPDDIMAELQMKSRSNDTEIMSCAHSVLQYLSQQFITGGAVIGKDSTNDSNNVLDFTLKLAEQNHNVVLLSNYIKTNQEYENYGFPIFTIQDIKELFENKSMLTNQAETTRLKITTHNNLASAKNLRNCILLKETNDNVGNVNIGKQTLEMGVQTEFDFIIEESSTVSITKNFIDNNTIQSIRQAENILHNSGSECKIGNPTKRREIRLKRNISQQLPNLAESNTEKKQYKWRRRKNIVLETPIESKDTKTDNANAVIDEPNELSTTFSNEDVPNETSHNQLDEGNEVFTENYDDNSDTTSGPCFDYNIVTKNTIIDETSTSGIISNTASNVDSESLYSLKNVSINVNDKCNYQDTTKCVMFEIENQIMEEHLEMRTDEWLSRFVQIMEEILTEILSLNPPFNHRSLPPPWTLHEATECIKNKFHADSDITDAASKLTEFLYQNSNKRGVINARLKPSSFMEMYSYGVYLVDSLQTAIDNCEDLQVAADSLAKLLADIQNADSYGVNNDSFNDNAEDPSANVTFCSSANSTEKGSTSTSNITKSNIVVTENRSGEDVAKNAHTSHDIRSNQNNSKEKIESPPSVKFIRIIDKEKTFSCLNLERKQSNYLSEFVDKSVEEDVMKNTTNTASNTIQNKTEPKIIRQFNTNEEFEERLRKKQRAVLDLESLDYTEGEHDEYYDEEYDYDYDIDNDLPESDTDYNNARKLNDNDGINDSKWVINKTINEVQHTLLQVRDFCNKTREELIASQPLSSDRKQKIQEQAQNARVHLNNLFESLNSVINREENECDANILAILNDAGVGLDASHAAEYRTVIGKRIEQGLLLLDSINLVIEAVKFE